MGESIKIKTKPIWRAKKGHPIHLSGAGLHQDRRTKRERTRATQQRKAINDWRD